jgi:hypothetical protein
VSSNFWSLSSLGCTIALASIVGCNPSPPTLGDIMGTYRLNAPVGVAVLAIGPNGVWEYSLNSKEPLSNRGKWVREQAVDSSGKLAIVLQEFQLGFKRYAQENPRPVNFFLTFEKTRSGQIQSCLTEDNQLCFIKE